LAQALARSAQWQALERSAQWEELSKNRLEGWSPSLRLCVFTELPQGIRVFADPKEGEKIWLDIPSPHPVM
jgi:hypothetical protein